MQSVVKHSLNINANCGSTHMEELMARSEFDEGCRADMAHISIDIKRALRSLTIQWVEYMRHLHAEYPYLYSLQVRKNPFSEEQNIVISD